LVRYTRIDMSHCMVANGNTAVGAMQES